MSYGCTYVVTLSGDHREMLEDLKKVETPADFSLHCDSVFHGFLQYSALRVKHPLEGEPLVTIAGPEYFEATATVEETTRFETDDPNVVAAMLRLTDNAGTRIKVFNKKEEELRAARLKDAE